MYETQQNKAHYNNLRCVKKFKIKKEHIFIL